MPAAGFLEMYSKPPGLGKYTCQQVRKCRKQLRAKQTDGKMGTWYLTDQAMYRGHWGG